MIRWTSCGRSVWLALVSVLMVSCAAAPSVMSAPGFKVRALRRAPVLIMPLATSSELGDDRTGVVLRNQSLLDAYKSMCEHAREDLTVIQVQCAYDASAAARPSMRALMLDFAHDRPPARTTLAALNATSGVRYVLLFRPESVDATRSQTAPDAYLQAVATTPAQDPTFASALGQSIGYGLGQLVASALGVPAGGVVTSRRYTVSAVLLDLVQGTAARFGAHSARGVKQGESYPEPAPILAEAMYELADAIIED
jgi:hypothetical protein